MPSQLLPLDLPPDLMLGRIVDLKASLATEGREPCVLHLGGGAGLHPSHALHLAELIDGAVHRGQAVIGDAIAPIYSSGALVWLACSVRTMYPSGYLWMESPQAIQAALRHAGPGMGIAVDDHGPSQYAWLDYVECMRRVAQLAEERDIFDRRIDIGMLQNLGLLHVPDPLLGRPVNCDQDPDAGSATPEL
ncbi:MAG: hypothetical protein IAE82_08845 [Opitutaceae bacterium]|nr:hypothetical protein [Opitutaceae bacterium]